jgi:putative DNA primase/helicase
MSIAREVAGKLKAKGPSSTGWWHAKCPFHQERKGRSLSFTEDGFNCNGGNCGVTGDITKLAAQVGVHVPRNEIARQRAPRTTRTRSTSSSSEAQAMSSLRTDRGLRDETLEKFSITFDAQKSAYKYPAANGSYRFKSWGGDVKYWWDGSAEGGHLYGLAHARQLGSEHVFVVEGEPDAWVMTQAGIACVSFTLGASNVPDEAVQTLRSSGYQSASIIYDQDKAGHRHRWDVHDELVASGAFTNVRVLELPPEIPYTEKHGQDITDLYRLCGHDDQVFREAIDGLTEPERPTHLPQRVVVSRIGGLSVDDTADNDFATRLIGVHGAILRHVRRMKKWIVFSEDEQRWVMDFDHVLVEELATHVGIAIKQESVLEPHRETSQKLFRLGNNALSRRAITGMVKLARGKDGIAIDHELLDRDPWLLGVKNGVIDLVTGEIRPADPDDLMTKQSPVVFDAEAISPRWDQAMEEWFDDPEVRDYVQRVAGSSLVGRQKDHQLVIHFGHGRNGKGTFVRAMQKVLGEYARVIHLSLLVGGKSSQHDTIKADLWGARLAIASETEKGVPLDEAGVKNLTGADRMTARRLYENPWEFEPTFSLALQTNYLPTISGRDHGVWSRIKVVEWLSTFVQKEKLGGGAKGAFTMDTDLDEKLAKEAAGILNWLVQGCLSWQKDGLKEPQAVIDATLAYREAEDVLARFVKDEKLVLGPSYQISSKKLQQLLAGFASREGLNETVLQRDLSGWLRDEKGLKKSQHQKARIWKGVGLKDEGGGYAV